MIISGVPSPWTSPAVVAVGLGRRGVPAAHSCAADVARGSARRGVRSAGVPVVEELQAQLAVAFPPTGASDSRGLPPLDDPLHLSNLSANDAVGLRVSFGGITGMRRRGGGRTVVLWLRHSGPSFGRVKAHNTANSRVQTVQNST